MTERERRRKIDPEAYDLLVRARATMLQLRPEAAIEAREILQRVIELGSGQALAYGAPVDDHLRGVREPLE